MSSSRLLVSSICHHLGTRLRCLCTHGPRAGGRPYVLHILGRRGEWGGEFARLPLPATGDGYLVEGVRSWWGMRGLAVGRDWPDLTGVSVDVGREHAVGEVVRTLPGGGNGAKVSEGAGRCTTLSRAPGWGLHFRAALLAIGDCNIAIFRSASMLCDHPGAEARDMASCIPPTVCWCCTSPLASWIVQARRAKASGREIGNGADEPSRRWSCHDCHGERLASGTPLQLANVTAHPS